MVLPRPTASATRSRGCSCAIAARNGSRWYGRSSASIRLADREARVRDRDGGSADERLQNESRLDAIRGRVEAEGRALRVLRLDLVEVAEERRRLIADQLGPADTADDRLRAEGLRLLLDDLPLEVADDHAASGRDQVEVLGCGGGGH